VVLSGLNTSRGRRLAVRRNMKNQCQVGLNGRELEFITLSEINQTQVSCVFSHMWNLYQEKRHECRKGTAGGPQQGGGKDRVMGSEYDWNIP
jgi:hypothetical protein